jgi:hypothetical protein
MPGLVSPLSAADLLSRVSKLAELRGFTSILGGDARSRIMITDRQAAGRRTGRARPS